MVLFDALSIVVIHVCGYFGGLFPLWHNSGVDRQDLFGALGRRKKIGQIQVPEIFLRPELYVHNRKLNKDGETEAGYAGHASFGNVNKTLKRSSSVNPGICYWSNRKYKKQKL